MVSKEKGTRGSEKQEIIACATSLKKGWSRDLGGGRRSEPEKKATGKKKPLSVRENLRRKTGRKELLPRKSDSN